MSTDDTEQTRAAALFTGILTLAAGGAGLLVAGMVLGFDYLLHGDPSEREQLRQARARQRRDRYAEAMAWLDADRTDRARARKAKRDWFNADPETRGSAPTTGETVGRLAGRAWNRMLISAVRFGRGWKQGRENAQQRRDAGEANWWKPVRVESEVGEPLTEAEPSTPPQSQPAPPAQPVTPEPPTQQAKADENDIVDAEIIPDPQPSEHSIVHVGQDEPQRPDETLDEYQRRLESLETEVQQNRNGQHPNPATLTRR